MPRTILAILFPSFLLVCAVAVIVALTDAPLLLGNRPQPAREQRAAVAIRDKVPVFQQFGTRLFTLPYLRKHYDEVYYFTQRSRGDCRDSFIYSLSRVCDTYEQVDIFLLAHSNTYYTWVETIPVEKRKHLRLVYNTGCDNAGQAEEWLNLGAKTFIGHIGQSESYIFYVYFLRRWVLGHTADEAVKQSNSLTARFIRRFSGGPDVEDVIRDSEAIIRGEADTRIAH